MMVQAGTMAWVAVFNHPAYEMRHFIVCKKMSNIWRNLNSMIRAIYLVPRICKVTKESELITFVTRCWHPYFLKIIQLTDISPLIWSLFASGSAKFSPLSRLTTLLTENAYFDHDLGNGGLLKSYSFCDMTVKINYKNLWDLHLFIV